MSVQKDLRTDSQRAARPVIFGEVLFDSFPDGSAVLGGAPFNVACHLQGFGLEPLFVSRIGDDEKGDAVRQAMERWGMDTSGLQYDTHHPTGTVEIILHDGQPTFTILPDQAYDFIDTRIAEAAISGLSPSLLYYGSLINRSPASAASLDALRAKGIAAFVDINLRAPWWKDETIDAVLAGARWAKLNDAELKEMAPQLGLDQSDLAVLARALRQKYGLALVIVTCGAEGAYLYSDDGGEYHCLPETVKRVVDTVGAGDAFSSVMILAILRGWSWPEALARAVEFAAALCEVRGATVAERSFYTEFLERWTHR